MTRVKTEKKLCPCCMEEHEVQTVVVRENNVFKGVPVEYDAEYFYEIGLATSDSKSLYDMADVKLCVIKVRRGEVNSQIVDRLKKLAAGASV